VWIGSLAGFGLLWLIRRSTPNVWVIRLQLAVALAALLWCPVWITDGWFLAFVALGT
jgi:hypothetical protein